MRSFMHITIYSWNIETVLPLVLRTRDIIQYFTHVGVHWDHHSFAFHSTLSAWSFEFEFCKRYTIVEPLNFSLCKFRICKVRIQQMQEFRRFSFHIPFVIKRKYKVNLIFSNSFSIAKRLHDVHYSFEKYIMVLTFASIPWFAPFAVQYAWLSQFQSINLFFSERKVVQSQYCETWHSDALFFVTVQKHETI